MFKTAPITQTIRSNLGLTDLNSLRGRFVTGLGGVVGLNASAICLSFLIHMVLARLLDPAGYGAYSYTMAWVRVMGVVTILGFDRLLVRELASHAEKRNHGLMKGIIRGADALSVSASVLVCALAGGIAYFFEVPGHPAVRTAFYIGLLALPVYSLLRLRKAALQGLHRVVLGQMLEALSQPLTFLVLIGALFFLTDVEFTAPLAMALYILAATAALFHGSALLGKSLPERVKSSTAVYDIPNWLRNAFPLILISGMMRINNNADILMLGSIAGVQAAGLYSVATRGAQIITFILTAADITSGPMIAQLHTQGERQRLQRLAVGSARVVFALSLSITMAFLVFGEWFLSLFGPEFAAGKPVLDILCLGRLINAATGSVGYLLVMTGHQRDSAWGVGISTALNVALNALLIPVYGAVGAAIATSVSMVTWNIILVYFVYKRLGMFPTALGRTGTPHDRAR